jgi:DnaK suppressor protein
MVTKSGNQRKATKSKTPRVVAARKSVSKVLPKKASRPTKQTVLSSKASTVRGKTSVVAKQSTKKKTASVSTLAKKSKSVQKTVKPSIRKSPVVPKKTTIVEKVQKTQAVPAVKVKKATAPIKVKRVPEKPARVRSKVKPLPLETAPVIQRVMSSNREFTPYRFEPYSPLKDEHYMSDQQLAHFRQILNSWKLELMREVDNTISGMKASSADVLADLNDRATQEEAFNLELRTRDRERKLLKKIEDALQQIDEKEYGYCESCGIEIGIRRLEARPTAALCIDCKTLAEIREKRVAQ